MADFVPIDALHPAVMEVFSTITSPVFSELVIVLGAQAVAYLPLGVMLFETLRTMNEARPFKLIFLFLGEAREELAGALDSVIARGLLDFLDSPPTIRSAQFYEHGLDMSFD